MSTSGFYKVDNGALLYAPNRVEHKDFTLVAGMPEWPADTDGWQWFDSEAEALAILGLTAVPSDLEVTDASD